MREIRALLKKDHSSVAKHLTRRKGELQRIVRVIDVLARAAASLREEEAPELVGCSGSPGSREPIGFPSRAHLVRRM
ncbi:MAG: hypothetical protein ACRDF0_01350 [Candidatus Limnocylindria bacterium]